MRIAIYTGAIVVALALSSLAAWAVTRGEGGVAHAARCNCPAAFCSTPCVDCCAPGVCPCDNPTGHKRP